VSPQEIARNVIDLVTTAGDDFPPLIWLYALRFALENPRLATPKIAPFIRQSLDLYKIGNVSRRQLLEQLLAPLEEAYRIKVAARGMRT